MSSTDTDQHTTLYIRGMTCVNCDAAIERALGGLPGVARVKASFRKGTAEVSSREPLSPDAVKAALEDEGYGLADAPQKNGYVEVAGIFLVLAGALFALNHYGLMPRGLGVSDTMSYGLVFLIGLVASVSSCIAVTGGLLVAVAAKYNEASGIAPGWQRFKPLAYFNAGRVISYTLLGGLVGLLGSALTLSPEANGILTILASAIMIVLGLSMLNLFPAAGRLLPRMPKAFNHAIHNLSRREAKGGAFILGAATFFLPCGFTQALQLYVLAKGSFTVGALTMFAFAIGTLPALLSLSAISSFAKGAFQRHFLRFAGVAVVLMGVLNIQYGLVLTGSNTVSAPTIKAAEAATPNRETAYMEGAKQVAVMRVVDFGYVPSEIVVKAGVPVEWRIDASDAAACGRVLLAPSLGIRTILSDKATSTISFTPQAVGEYAFNCSMGMMTPGAKIVVVPNT